MLQGLIREVAGTEMLGSDLVRLRKKSCAYMQKALRDYAKWRAENY
jgi:hypothetical protein